MSTTSDTATPLEVVIAGGGVAALEAMMALRALAPDHVSVTLLSPERDFRYRPMAVAEPFTIAHARSYRLDRIAADFGATVVQGALGSVHARDHRIATRTGAHLDYDALVIACGARGRPALPGSLTIDDRNLGGMLRGLVQDVEQGYALEIAFVAPAQAFWLLPVYELALLTARRADEMCIDVALSIVTPESEPLAIFGLGVSGAVAEQLHAAGIAFHGSSYAEPAPGGGLTLRPDGRHLGAERIVSLPLLEGPRIAGLPMDGDGFVPVTEQGAVRGVEDVYGAGDATTFAIKHGGVAAQQADVVADAIAARAGVPVEPRAFRPVIRAILLTGARPRYLEAEIAGGAGLRSAISDSCPWSPPTKIVARHLGPYLAERDGLGARGEAQAAHA